MVKEEFYRKMLALYASTANSERKQELVNAMNTVLDDDTDFDALYQTILKEHQSLTMPTPAWLMTHKRRKYNTPVKDSLYWTALVKTSYGDYEFAIEMKYTEEQVAKAYREKRGWTFLKGNRQEVLITNGLA